MVLHEWKILNFMLLRGRIKFCFYKILCFFSTDISKSAQDVLLCRTIRDTVLWFFMPLGLDIRRRRGMTNNHWTVKRLKTSSRFLKYAGVLTVEIFCSRGRHAAEALAVMWLYLSLSMASTCWGPKCWGCGVEWANIMSQHPWSAAASLLSLTTVSSGVAVVCFTSWRAPRLICLQTCKQNKKAIQLN